MLIRLMLPLYDVGDPINEHFDSVCAHLAEHYNLKPADVLAMTRNELYSVYYHSRNKDGELEIIEQRRYQYGPREAFQERWRRVGVWEPEILELWWRDFSAAQRAAADEQRAIKDLKRRPRRERNERRRF